MKCAIVYFSQTNNTEKIAKEIQKGVIAEAGNCDLLKLRDTDPKKLYGYDLIGIGSPVHRWEPINVGDFINNMWSVGGKHSFAFCTHGTIPDLYFHSMYQKMGARGMTVIGFGDWYADVALPWHPEPYPTAGHPDQIDFDGAREFGREMVRRSKRISTGETDLIPPAPLEPPPDPNDTPELRATIKDTTDDPAIFKYHKELCKFPKCRLCMDNCHMYSIDLSMDPPRVATNCSPHCVFCTLLCPTGALEIDEFVAEQAPCYKRTTHEYAYPILERAEAAGHFRRILPKEQVGWGTFFFEVHSGHPKFILGKGTVGKKKDK
jgi:flavodoxin